jgi:predicted thioesterase
MEEINTGSSAVVTAVVGIEDTAIALGSGDVEVLATPRVVAMVEAAAIAALGDRLAMASTSVGTHIELRHLAPSPIGAVVTARAEITAVERRTITFAVEARDGDTLIADGTHTRVVVRREGFGS